ncbi:MAG: hypothetical protein H7Z14_00105 [Anaerolineae bacterium]|nr:hypothetical protein [Phycisphaerae bacterium]
MYRETMEDGLCENEPKGEEEGEEELTTKSTKETKKKEKVDDREGAVADEAIDERPRIAIRGDVKRAASEPDGLIRDGS